MKRAGHRAAMVGALLLAVISAQAQANAQTQPQPNTQTQAQPQAPIPQKGELAKHLREGAEAARAKRWDTCIDAYTRALRLDDVPATQGELGLCEDALGRNVEAFRHLSAAMRAPAADRTKEPWKRFSVALARVAARVAQVFVAVEPPQAAVVVDGRPTGKSEGRSIVLEPGSHTFAARLAGHHDAIETRVLQAGDLPTVYLRLLPKPIAAPAVSPPLVSPPPDRSSAVPSAASAVGPAAAWYAPAWSPRGVLVTMTYAGAATLVVSGATAIGLEIDRASLRSPLTKSACDPDAASLPSSCGPLLKRGAQRDAAVDLTAGVAIATGVMAGLAGVAIHLELGQTSAAITPTVGTGGGGGIVIDGAW